MNNGSKINKFIVYNYNNNCAVIYDIKYKNAIGDFNKLEVDIIYVAENDEITANDIAALLIDEGGDVYYYDSESKEKVLINKNAGKDNK